MAVLDIRTGIASDNSPVTGIAFDDIGDAIEIDEDGYIVIDTMTGRTSLCKLDDFTNLIAAIGKAVELWGCD